MNQYSRPLLILGSARSGTTLLQRILNSYDNVIIWGEHGGALRHIANSYFELINSESMQEFSYPQAKGPEVDLSYYKNPEQWQAWNNWFRPDDVCKTYKYMLENMFESPWRNQVRYWGFKEIRYGSSDKVIDLFLSCFPDTRVLFLYRNPLNVIDSQLQAFENIGGRLQAVRKTLNLGKVVRLALRWRRLNKKLLAYHHTFPENVLILRYETMISDTNVLQSVMARIGLGFGQEQRTVLGLKSGRGSAYQGARRNDTNTRWKSLGLIPSIAVYLITRRVYADLKREL